MGGLDDFDADEVNAKLPTLVPGIRTAYSTPLPVLPMVVLCIVRPPPLCDRAFRPDSC